MHLSPHSLRQIDDAYLQSLEVEALRGLSMRLLADLKEAWDRLNQGPENSSRPPSSRAPWERKHGEPPSDEDLADGELEPEPAEPQSAEAKPAEANPAEANPAEAKSGGDETGPQSRQTTRGAGDRPHAGVPGECRTGPLPRRCAGCGRPLEPAGAVAYTGFQAVDLRGDDPARPGLTLWVVDHRYYEIPCPCGHRTRAVAGHGGVDPLLAGIELNEWRRWGRGWPP